MFDGLIAFFGTRDLEENEKFYVEALGLKLYKDQGVCKIYKVKENAYIGFCSHLEITVAKRGPIITILSDDVDAVYKNLIDKGLKPLDKPKRNRRFNIYHFFIADPDGYLIEVQKFL